MRRFRITVRTGDDQCPTMVVYRDVRDEDMTKEFLKIDAFPFVSNVTAEQKEGESLPDYRKAMRAIDEENTRC